MKKLITLLLAGMLCVTAAACSGSQEPAKTDNTATPDTAQTAEVTEAPQEEATEPKDLIVSEKVYYSGWYDNETGQTIEKNEEKTYEYEFDSEGRQTKVSEYVNGKLNTVREAEYNADGQMIKQTVRNADGIISDVYEYEFDGNNNTKLVSYDGSGNVTYETSFEYDENGFLIAESYKSSDSYYTMKYENNKDGKALTITQNDNTGGEEATFVTKNEYDSNGNLTATVQYDIDGSENSRCEYEYDGKGHVITATTTYFYNNGESASYKTENEYDDRGNQIKSVYYGPDSEIMNSFESVYKTVKELRGK